MERHCKMAASVGNYNILQWHIERIEVNYSIEETLPNVKNNICKKKQNFAVANIGRDTLQLMAIMMRTQMMSY